MLSAKNLLRRVPGTLIACMIGAMTVLVGAIPASAAFVGPLHSVYNPSFYKCMGVDPSDNAIIYRCTSHPDQTWNWGNPLNGNSSYKQIKNSNGKCLALWAGHVTEGTKVDIAPCTVSALDQYWGFFAIP